MRFSPGKLFRPLSRERGKALSSTARPIATLVALVLLLGMVTLSASAVRAEPGAEQDGLGQFDRDLQRLAKKVKPSVVSVQVIAVSEATPPPEKDDSSVKEKGSQTGTTGGLHRVRRVLYRASGLVSNRDGEIITVISARPWEYDLDPSESLTIEVELHNGELYVGSLDATDPETGITLLSLLHPPKKLRPVRFAKGTPQQGATVVSVGADGFALGYIAHPARGVEHGSASFPRGIVTSIEAQPGDVGGMLANPEGELVGILAFSLAQPRGVGDSPETGRAPEGVQEGRASGTGVGADSETAYEKAGRPEWGGLGACKVTTPRDGGPLGRSVAIPADLLQRIVFQLRKDGVMKRGALGATFQFHHPALAENSHIGAGARVRKLTLGGAAETAGLRVDDVIQKIDQRFLRRPEDLLWFREVVEYGEIGRHLTVTVARMENHRIVARTLRVPIGTRPEGSRGDELEDPPCEPDCAPEPGGRPKPDKTPTVEPQSGGKIGA